MKAVTVSFVLCASLGFAGCSSTPQKVELKDAVAEVVQNCKGKVNVSYTNRRGAGESVNATCDNSNTEEVVTTKGNASDPAGFQKSIKRSYW